MIKVLILTGGSSMGASNGIRAVYVDKYNADRMIAGTFRDGTFVTTDGGNLWKNIHLPANRNINPSR